MSIWSPPLQITESEARLLAEIERLRGLLREARQRTQNLLHRQHGDAIIMNPDEYLRATLSWLDDALAESGHESGQNGPSAADQPAAAPQAPIARVSVWACLPPSVTLYAPGLPPGEYDLYCEPEATAPMLRAADNAAAQPDAALPFDAIQIHGHELRLVYQGKPMAAWRFDPRDADSTWTLAGGIEGRASLTLAADSIAAPTPTPQPAAAPKPKRAYYETHEPPHCPTCECGADNAAAQPAAAPCGHIWVYSTSVRDWECTKCGRRGRTADNSGAAT